jgi:hypothetical protein
VIVHEKGRQPMPSSVPSARPKHVNLHLSNIVEIWPTVI